MQPVSVVVTVLNEARDIERGVASLLAQKPSATEVIVVDGGSTDGTWERLVEMQAQDARLVAIRDETCSLKHSPGPISRGRNTAIRAARSEVIATADAGCAYAPNWLANLTAPVVAGSAEYALGGSCLDLSAATVWDLASAHFFGVRLEQDAPTKSCTARSMAFRRELWEKIGGFPEDVFFGEDTLFDLRARNVTMPAFVKDAKAFYRPQFSLISACRQLASYSVSDGILGVRRARLFRNGARCALEVAAIFSLPWTPIPLLVALTVELWFAFRHNAGILARKGYRAVFARLAFSILVPWIVTTNRIYGSLTGRVLPNRQNL